MSTNICQFPGCSTIKTLIYTSNESDKLTCNECKAPQPAYIADADADDDDADDADRKERLEANNIERNSSSQNSSSSSSSNNNSSSTQEPFKPTNWLHFLDISSFDFDEPDSETDKIIQNYLMQTRFDYLKWTNIMSMIVTDSTPKFKSKA